MSEWRDVLERAREGIRVDPGAFERVARRRSRKQRNSRIGSAAVGIVVVLVATWAIVHAFGLSGPVRPQPTSPVIEPSNVGSLQSRWRYDVPPRGPMGTIFRADAVDVPGMFLVSATLFQALDDRTGRLLWTGRPPVEAGGGYTTAAASAGGRVYTAVANPRGTAVYGFPLRCGGDRGGDCAPAWASGEVSETLSRPLIVGSDLFVSTGHGVIAFSLACTHGCAPAWIGDVGPSRPASFGSRSPLPAAPVAVRDRVFAVTAEGRLIGFSTSCHRPTCSAVWEARTTDTFRVAPTVDNNFVYATSVQGRLFAFPPHCAATACPPAWTGETGTGSELTSPVQGFGSLFAGSYDGGLYAFRSSCRGTCRPAWVGSTTRGIEIAPVVAGSVVVAATVDGTLEAFDPACSPLPLACSALWTGHGDAPQALVGSPRFVLDAGLTSVTAFAVTGKGS